MSSATIASTIRPSVRLSIAAAFILPSMPFTSITSMSAAAVSEAAGASCAAIFEEAINKRAAALIVVELLLLCLLINVEVI